MANVLLINPNNLIKGINEYWIIDDLKLSSDSKLSKIKSTIDSILSDKDILSPNDVLSIATFTEDYEGNAYIKDEQDLKIQIDYADKRLEEYKQCQEEYERKQKRLDDKGKELFVMANQADINELGKRISNIEQTRAKLVSEQQNLLPFKIGLNKLNERNDTKNISKMCIDELSKVKEELEKNKTLGSDQNLMNKICKLQSALRQVPDLDKLKNSFQLRQFNKIEKYINDNKNNPLIYHQYFIENLTSGDLLIGPHEAKPCIVPPLFKEAIKKQIFEYKKQIKEEKETGLAQIKGFFSFFKKISFYLTDYFWPSAQTKEIKKKMGSLQNLLEEHSFPVQWKKWKQLKGKNDNMLFDDFKPDPQFILDWFENRRDDPPSIKELFLKKTTYQHLTSDQLKQLYEDLNTLDKKYNNNRSFLWGKFTPSASDIINIIREAVWDKKIIKKIVVLEDSNNDPQEFQIQDNQSSFSNKSCFFQAQEPTKQSDKEIREVNGRNRSSALRY